MKPRTFSNERRLGWAEDDTEDYLLRCKSHNVTYLYLEWEWPSVSWGLPHGRPTTCAFFVDPTQHRRKPLMDENGVVGGLKTPAPLQLRIDGRRLVGRCGVRTLWLSFRPWYPAN